MTKVESVAVCVVAFFVALIFSSGIAGCTYSSKYNTENDTKRMKACVEQHKDWLYVDRVGAWQCVGGNR